MTWSQGKLPICLRAFWLYVSVDVYTCAFVSWYVCVYVCIFVYLCAICVYVYFYLYMCVDYLSVLYFIYLFTSLFFHCFFYSIIYAFLHSFFLSFTGDFISSTNGLLLSFFHWCVLFFQSMASFCSLQEALRLRVQIEKSHLQLHHHQDACLQVWRHQGGARNAQNAAWHHLQVSEEHIFESLSRIT